MKLGAWGAAGRDLRALFDGGATAALSDGQLLARFADGPSGPTAEAAFSALVARHGPMVWGACRRILRDPHAADDAFQATFLLLARKAGSIRVEDSLGRWLHGAGVRVALLARAVGRRRAAGDLGRLDLPASPASDPGLADLRAAIDEEVARLPPAYRSVVVLCHLEGLTRERAAARLGCPVGTVNSRLSRARELLKVRLTRRGLAPASASASAALAWLAAEAASAAAAPPRLAAAVEAAAARLAAGGMSAGSAPTGVAALSREILRRIATMNLMKAAACGSPLVALAVLVAAPAGPGGEAPRAEGVPAVAKPADPPPKPPTPLEEARAIEAEWEAADGRYRAEMAKARTRGEEDAVYAGFHPRELDYFRRCLDLADAHPGDPGALEALLWVVSRGLRKNDAVGPTMGPVGKAVEALVRDFADDPRVARAALNVTHFESANRSALIRGLYAGATGREAEGVACLALAEYLGKEATWTHHAQAGPIRPETRAETRGDRGKPQLRDGPELRGDAYWRYLRSRDEAATRAESEALYRRVIDEFGEIPYNPWHYEGGKVVKNPRPRTLAHVAEARLDDIHNLVVGRPAPEIEGVDLDGRPLKLSDHRGKVVVLAFWFAGCGPCIAAVPGERALVERLEGRPFALLGVNSDEEFEAARKAAEDSGMTWPSWRDGAPDAGPIADRYHVRAYPTVFVIDAKGILRDKNAHAPSLAKQVEELLAEIPATPRPTAPPRASRRGSP